jgi:membrane protease YdiL (CAAX protease family)
MKKYFFKYLTKEKGLPFWIYLIAVILIAVAGGLVRDLLNKRFAFPIISLLSVSILFCGIFIIMKLPVKMSWHELGFRKNKIFYVALCGVLIGYLGGLASLVLFSLNQQALSANCYKLNPFFQGGLYLLGLIHPMGIAVVITAIAEEILFRGILLRKAINSFPKNIVIPILLVSITFSFLHLGYFSSSSSLMQTIFGISFFLAIQIICCWGIIKFDNLYFSIFFHYAYNQTIFSITGFN